ncbi:aminopeptidase [Rhizina undulata]
MKPSNIATAVAGATPGDLEDPKDENKAWDSFKAWYSTFYPPRPSDEMRNTDYEEIYIMSPHSLVQEQTCDRRWSLSFKDPNAFNSSASNHVATNTPPIPHLSGLPSPKNIHTQHTMAPTSQFGQPTHETHPHLLKAGEVTPECSALEYDMRRAKLASEFPEGDVAILPSWVSPTVQRWFSVRTRYLVVARRKYGLA